MTAITKGAIRAIKFYKHIVQSVEKFIQKCKPEYKIPGLYVIDSIVRQVSIYSLFRFFLLIIYCNTNTYIFYFSRCLIYKVQYFDLSKSIIHTLTHSHSVSKSNVHFSLDTSLDRRRTCLRSGLPKTPRNDYMCKDIDSI